MRILAVDQDAVLSAGRGFWRALNIMQDCEVKLLAPDRWSGLGPEARFEDEQNGLEVVRTRVIFRGKSHRAIYTGLSALVKKVSPDILFVNAEPESFLAWQAVHIKKRHPEMKVACISWRNIDYPQGVFPYKLAFLNAWAERQVLKHADHLIARNSTAKQIFGKKGFARVTVIPPPVDTGLFTQTGSRSEDEHPFTIGFAGRIVPAKGIDLLLEAVAQLQGNYRVLIIGDGSAKASLQRLAESLGVDRHVEWVPGVNHPDMPRYLRQMDVLVLPSRGTEFWKEQFGRILVEAMACGIPVIGSDSGEIPELVGDAGLIFREGSAEGLKIALERIRNGRELRHDLVEAGLSLVRTEFAISALAPAYHLLFRLLAGRTGKTLPADTGSTHDRA